MPSRACTVIELVSSVALDDGMPLYIVTETFVCRLSQSYRGLVVLVCSEGQYCTGPFRSTVVGTPHAANSANRATSMLRSS